MNAEHDDYSENRFCNLNIGMNDAKPNSTLLQILVAIYASFSHSIILPLAPLTGQRGLPLAVMCRLTH